MKKWLIVGVLAAGTGIVWAQTYEKGQDGKVRQVFDDQEQSDRENEINFRVVYFQSSGDQNMARSQEFKNKAAEDYKNRDIAQAELDTFRAIKYQDAVVETP